jgi:hypothetical protein
MFRSMCDKLDGKLPIANNNDEEETKTHDEGLGIFQSLNESIVMQLKSVFWAMIG